MRIEQTVYCELCEKLMSLPPERGGILGMQNGIICIYHLDDSPVQTDRYAYIPNVSKLNAVLKRWYDDGIDFAGMFHSHPYPQTWLSIADREYIRKIMDAMPDSVSQLHFPLIVPEIGMIGYLVRKQDGEIISEDIVQEIE